MRRIGRREFITTAAVAIATGRAAAQASAKVIAASAKAGTALDGAIQAALGSLGGIKAFIRGGERVALLPNPQGFRTGASTRPDLAGAVARMCLDAGAAEVRICSIHDMSRWKGTGIVEAVAQAGGGFWFAGEDSDWREVAVPEPLRQSKIKVVAPALEADVVINLPIAKHHGSTQFTGAMKNLMGFNSGNSAWHNGTDFLVGSIVDLNSVVKPRLHIVDVTEVLAENGPFGPGRNVSPGRIVAGVDPVAVDTVCAGLLEMDPGSISTITTGAGRGLGTSSLAEVSSTAGLTTWRAS